MHHSTSRRERGDRGDCESICRNAGALFRARLPNLSIKTSNIRSYSIPKLKNKKCNRKIAKMPSGSCFCGNVKVEYNGEPAMTVIRILAEHLNHADPFNRHFATVLTAERLAEATTATTLLSRVDSLRLLPARPRRSPRLPTAERRSRAVSALIAVRE